VILKFELISQACREHTVSDATKYNGNITLIPHLSPNSNEDVPYPSFELAS